MIEGNNVALDGFPGCIQHVDMIANVLTWTRGLNGVALVAVQGT
jgi:hypothetical protein